MPRPALNTRQRQIGQKCRHDLTGGFGEHGSSIPRKAATDRRTRSGGECAQAGYGHRLWTGIGAVGAFVVGVLVLGEPLTIARVLAAALIVAGLSVMKLSTAA